MIGTLNLGERVRFSNTHFRVDDLPKLLEGATLGIIPNRRDAATRHMLPVKLLEYVYLGIPTVVPRLDAIQHYFQDDMVGYYEPGQVDSLRRAMLDILTNPERGAALARRAHSFTQQHAWDRMKLELFALVDA